MSKTFQISNGDLFINPSTGAVREIVGPEKAFQDVAESLLTAFDPSRNFGSSLDAKDENSVIIGALGEGEVKLRIQDAIDRLILDQSNDPNITDDERIDKIEDITVDFQNDGTEILFLVTLSTVDKNKLEVGDKIVFSPTKLNHLLPKSLEQDKETLSDLIRRTGS